MRKWALREVREYLMISTAISECLIYENNMAVMCNNSSVLLSEQFICKITNERNDI